jgi:hypothetical protein
LADNDLKLTASVRDDFTATLRKLQNDLKNLSVDPAPAKIRKDWMAVGQEVKTAASGVATTFLPALGRLNVGAIGAAAALTGIAKGVQTFTGDIRAFGKMAKDFGTSSPLIFEQIALGARVSMGLAKGEVFSALRDMSIAVRNFQVSEQARSALEREFLDLGRDLAGFMMQPHTFEETWDRLVQAIRNAGAWERAQALGAAFGLGPEMVRYIRSMTPTLEAEVKRLTSVWTPERQEAAKKWQQAYQTAMAQFEVASTGFRERALGPLLTASAALLEKWREPVGNFISAELDALEKKIPPVLDALQKIKDFKFSEGIPQLENASGSDLIGVLTQQIREGLSNYVKSFFGGKAEAAPTTGAGQGHTPTTPGAILTPHQFGPPAPMPGAILTPHQFGPALPDSMSGHPSPPRRPIDLAAAQAQATETKAVEDNTASQERLKETTDRARTVMERLRDGIAHLAELAARTGAPEAGGLAPGGGFGGTGFGGAGGAGGIAGGMGGIGPAGRGRAGMPSGPSGGAPIAPGSSWTAKYPGTPQYVYDYIREAARARGIDPGTAVAVANSEGLRAGGFDPDKTKWDARGDRGLSGGPFQLFMGGGLGNRFAAAGHGDPRDTSTWKKQVDFALDVAKNEGWSAWYGARRIGLDRYAGIGGRAGYQAPAMSTPEGGSPHRAAHPASAAEISRNMVGLRQLMATSQAAGLHINSSFRRGGGSSLHGHARALDLRAHTMEQADQVMATAEAAYGRLGLIKGKDFNFFDEVRHRSAGWTGPHVHVSFSQAGMEKLLGHRDGEPSPAADVRLPPVSGGRLPRRERPGALLDRASETGINGGSPSAKIDARGSVNITLSDSLKDKKVKTDTTGMFKRVQVGRGRPARPPENVDDWT